MQIHPSKLLLAACVGIALALAALAVAGLTGCSTQGKTSGNYIDDRMVSSRVKGALNDASNYKFPDVEVSSYNGTVQLNGFVANQDQKLQAADIASRQQGVKQLVNNITVQPTVSPTGRTNSMPVYPDIPPTQQ